MVNFGDLNQQTKQPSVVEPRQLFQTLQRDKQHEYLRDVQGDVLDEWYGRKDERDLVIKMNTGSGKTLVGLVVLWSRLKDGKGPALYLCPNRHLASQVRREADSLGINHVDFGINNLFPPEFHNSTGILITTVQKLFNGLSVFRVAGRPDPVTVGTLLVDDAHTCINIAREQFMISLDLTSQLGGQLFNLFESSLRQQSPGMYADISRGKHDAYLRVPYWTWQQHIEDVAHLISGRSDSDDVRFVWPFLKIGEVLSNSVAGVSGTRIEISPKLTPIELVPSFHAAEHRTYMSATLVDDSALIKEFAADPKSVQKPIEPKVGGDIGERLILSPSLVDHKIEELNTVKLVSYIRDAHEVNVVVLVPSKNKAAIWRNDGSLEVPGLDISDVVDRLASTSSNTAIIANRYDGIDLPDAACRILVVYDLPQEHRISSLTEASARQNSPILRKQIAQRIEQGMGRGVRSRADFCVVVLAGASLVTFMTEAANQMFFTEETKRQIEIGRDLASILKQQGGNSFQTIIDLMGQCLNRDEEWQRYHREALQDVGAGKAGTESSIALASAELEAWQYAFRGRYTVAAKTIAELTDNIEGLSGIDVGWYLQMQADYLHHDDPLSALEKQLKAHELNPSLLKPPSGISYRRMQIKKTGQAYAVLDWMKQSTEPNALVSRANTVFEGLSFGVSHNTFEQAFSDLGNILGFQSQRPEMENGRGPDVLWCMDNSLYLIVEAKNQVDSDREFIYKKEAEQLGHHVTWFQQEYAGETYIPALIHPSATLYDDAYLMEGTKVIQKDDLEEMVGKARRLVVALASKPVDQWDVSDVAQQLQAHQLRATDLVSSGLGKLTARLGT